MKNKLKKVHKMERLVENEVITLHTSPIKLRVETII